MPYSTMFKACAPICEGGPPTWLHQRDVMRVVHLPRSGGVKGGGTVLGAVAEKKLMVLLADAAKAHMPYQIDEVEELVRETLIEMKAVVRKTGEPYSEQTGDGAPPGRCRFCARAGACRCPAARGTGANGADPPRPGVKDA